MKYRINSASSYQQKKFDLQQLGKVKFILLNPFQKRAETEHFAKMPESQQKQNTKKILQMPSSITHFRPYNNILSLSPRRFKPVLKVKSSSILKLKSKDNSIIDFPSNFFPQPQQKNLPLPFSINSLRQQSKPKVNKLFKRGR